MPSIEVTQKAQPWKADWERQAKTIEPSSEEPIVSKITGFERGELILIGGQVGSSTTVICDTAKIPQKEGGFTTKRLTYIPNIIPRINEIWERI